MLRYSLVAATIMFHLQTLCLQLFHLTPKLHGFARLPTPPLLEIEALLQFLDAILTIVGDVETDKAKRLVEFYFRGIATRGTPRRNSSPEPAQRGEQLAKQAYR